MTLRVAILCNSRLCLPAVSWLIQSGMAVAVGMPEDDQETHLLIKLQCTRSKIPFTDFRKENLAGQLQQWLQLHQPDVVLVKTFPWLIPATVLSIPPKGFINFHYAPLPAFRGPNPLFWMIRHQVREGGVSVHQMDEHFDTGPILLQQSLPISPDLTYGWLSTQLAYLGLQLCWTLLQGLAAGTLQPVPQTDQAGEWYPRPVPANMVVHWDRMSAHEIRALCLACNPWNKGAATSFNDWSFGITDVSVITDHNVYMHTHIPGTIISIDERNGLLVSCLHTQLLRVNVIYCEEGFFPGHQLASFGIRPGNRLGHYTPMPSSIPPQTHSSSTLLQSIKKVQ